MKRNKPTMRICTNRGKIQWILPIQKGILRSCQPNCRILNTGLVGQHKSSHKRRPNMTREKLFDVLIKLQDAGY